MIYQSNWVIDKFDDCNKFESLARDVLMALTGVYFQKYGRNGQNQHGIDAIGQLNTQQCIMAQFKNRINNNSSELIRELSQDIDNAIQYFGREKIHSFYIVTSHDRDTVVHEFCVIKQSEYNVPIYIFFWDDIVKVLKDNLNLYHMYLGFNDETYILTEIYKDVNKLEGIICELRYMLMFCFCYQNGVSNAFPKCIHADSIKQHLLLYKEILSRNNFYVKVCDLVNSMCFKMPDISESDYQNIDIVVRKYQEKFSYYDNRKDEFTPLLNALKVLIHP